MDESHIDSQTLEKAAEISIAVGVVMFNGFSLKASLNVQIAVVLIQIERQADEPYRIDFGSSAL